MSKPLPTDPLAGLDRLPFFQTLTKRLWDARAQELEPRTLGEAVRWVREGLGISFQHMAQRVGCTASQAYYMEQDKFRSLKEAQVTAVAFLAQELGMIKTASYILKWAGPIIITSKGRTRRDA